MARRTALAAPRIDPIPLPDLADGDVAQLLASASHDARRFAQLALDGLDLADVSFSECAFADVSIADTDLRAARFVETVIDRLSAPILTAPRAHLRDVRIAGSRVGSAELYQSGWQGVEFVGCKLGYLNLRGAELRDVRFTDCTIDELDLGGARATRLAFPGSQLRSLDVTRANLTDVDLRGLDLERLSGLEGLKGATIDTTQVARLADLFAERLGVRIQD